MYFRTCLKQPHCFEFFSIHHIPTVRLASKMISQWKVICRFARKKSPPEFTSFDYWYILVCLSWSHRLAVHPAGRPGMSACLVFLNGCNRWRCDRGCYNPRDGIPIHMSFNLESATRIQHGHAGWTPSWSLKMLQTWVEKRPNCTQRMVPCDYLIHGHGSAVSMLVFVDTTSWKLMQIDWLIG